VAYIDLREGAVVVAGRVTSMRAGLCTAVTAVGGVITAVLIAAVIILILYTLIVVVGVGICH
jgi:hypothetical protein